MICGKCGATVEENGKFCGNCGARINEKRVCPQCGAIYKGRFCGNCGYGGKEGRRRTTDKGWLLVARYSSAVLLALFSGLLFAFYSAPVMKLWGESLGNVYEIAAEELYADVQGMAKGLIVFAIVGVVLSAVWSFLWILPFVRTRRVFKNATIGDVCVLVGAAYYLTSFIIACVLAGQITKEEIEVGATTTLMIVFSWVFLVLSLVATGIAVGFGGATSNIEEKEKNLSVPLQKPVAPKSQTEPVFMRTAEADAMRALRVEQYRLSIGTFLPLLAYCCAFLLWQVGVSIARAVHVSSAYVGMNEAYVERLLTTAISMLLLLPLCLLRNGIIKSIPQARWNIAKLAGKGKMFLCLLSLFVTLIFAWGMIWYLFFEGSALLDFANMITTLIALGAFFLLYAWQSVQWFRWSSLRKKALKACDFTALCLEDEKNRAQYRANVSAYQAYLREQAQYEYDKKRYEAGARTAKKVNGVGLWIKQRKALVTVCLAVFVGVVAWAGGAIAKNASPDRIFHINTVAAVRLDTPKQLVKWRLGNPHREMDECYEYFSENYRILSEEIEDLNREIARVQASMDLLELAKLNAEQSALLAELKNMQYDYIRVLFNDRGLVESVRLERNKCDGKETIEKTKIGAVTVFVDENEALRGERLWRTEIYYADGSYQLVKTKAAGEISGNGNGFYAFAEHLDDWGSVIVRQKVAGYEGFARGVLVRYQFRENVLHLSGNGNVELSALRVLVESADEIVCGRDISVTAYNGMKDLPIRRVDE